MLAFQTPFLSERQEKYVGRKFALKETLSQVKRLLRIGGLISVTGSPGAGKTSFLVSCKFLLSFSCQHFLLKE